MGAKNSKEQINEDLLELGKKESSDLKDLKDLSFEKSESEIELPINDTNNFIFISNNPDPKKDYEIIKCLKKGAYSDIYLVENKLSKLRCIMKSTAKTKSFSKNEEDLLNNELKILSILDHPNIIKVFSFYSNEDSYSYITEFCEEGDLYEQLLNKGAYDEKTAAYIMHQIFSAVNYCHKNKITYLN